MKRHGPSPAELAAERVAAQNDQMDSWLAERRAARRRNAAAALAPFATFRQEMADGDRMAKETARELLKKAGVSDETFEIAWEKEP